MFTYNVKGCELPSAHLGTGNAPTVGELAVTLGFLLAEPLLGRGGGEGSNSA